MNRRTWLTAAAVGSTLGVLGGLYRVVSDAEAAELPPRPDGRPRVPPGQKLLEQLKPMGGQPGAPDRKSFRLKVSGEVERPQVLDFSQLMALGPVEEALDVHCVTGWTVLGAKFRGVRLAKLAEHVGVGPRARYVIFEAAHGYTANVPLREALRPDVLLASHLDGKPLRRQHGAPVRAVVPSLYFWKSAKWLTGVRFTSRDDPGYWERRGYHNHGDPWLEERYG